MRAPQSEGKATVQDVAVDEPLQRLADLAQELGSDRAHQEAEALARRIAEGRFYVACVGQFKRGKSTLLNALLGERILPTGVLPLTAVPTVVRYGSSRGARVRFERSTWTDIQLEDLAEYVSEELNPENKKGVVAVEVLSPDPLLAQGMCLVDTPGLGSIFAGNTAATQAFVPHVDAAIVVLGADLPITGEELTLVKKIGAQVANLFIVLNKADRSPRKERELAKEFARKILEKQLGRSPGYIYEVSAEEQLGSSHGPPRDWREFVAALETLVRGSGPALVRGAGERGIKRLAAELSAITSEERQALTRPIEESELRIRTLRETISEAERSLREITYLFMAEEHRLSDKFLEHRKQFLATTMPKARAEFEENLREMHQQHYGPTFRRSAFRAAQAVAEHNVRPWLQTEQANAEQEYRYVSARFVDIGNNFLRKLIESGVTELTCMPTVLESDEGFRVSSRFTFEQLLNVALPASPLRYLADVTLGMVRAYARIEKQACAFLGYLMEMNSTRVQSDVVNRVRESRGQLEVEIRKLLHEVTRIAERALDRARIARAEGAEAVEAALARLDRVDWALQSICESNKQAESQSDHQLGRWHPPV